MSIFFIFMTLKLCIPSCSRALLGESEQANIAEPISCFTCCSLWCHFLTLTGGWGEVKFPGGPGKDVRGLWVCTPSETWNLGPG